MTTDLDQRVALVIRPMMPGQVHPYLAELLKPANLGQLTPNVETRMLSSIAVVSKSGTVRTLQATHSLEKLAAVAGERYH